MWLLSRRSLGAGLAPVLALLSVAGCSSRAVGSSKDALPGEPDGSARPDAYVLPDGGLPTLWGTVAYEDERRETGGPGQSARFTAAFYEVDYMLPIAVPPGYVETRVTHDNVECDIFFTSPDWGGGPPPVPPEPDQVDAGEIRLESAFDAGGAFTVSWEGLGYTVDERPSAQAPLPGWVVPEELEALAIFVGSPRLPAGNQRLSLVATPTLLEPVTDGVVQPDADGLFRIAWESDPDVPVQVRLDMNMDWDNATFLCRPPTGHPQVLLPQTWLNEYSWGYVELRVTALQSERHPASSAVLSYRIRRATYRSVEFEIQW